MNYKFKKTEKMKNDRMNRIELFILTLAIINHLESKKLAYVFDADYFDANQAQKKINELTEFIKIEYLPVFN